MNSNDYNKYFKDINKDISEANKEIKQQQKENKQKLNDSTLTILKLMSEDMRIHKASEQSIQLALKGTYEFYKIVTKAQV